ncbi:MAG TPA: reverse transcriptase domain-containing protein [Chloroflexota bacterium]|nr:reverse transcriptase domain-containing protein [Chloroflexota bacterium]
MRDANTVLGVIRDRGTKGLPLERVYRLLFNPDLFLLAYGRIARNRGALTPGATEETADGMSLAKIGTLIEQLRSERFRWTPVRRVYIEKKNSTKKRALGLPTWSDKLVQEVVRLILEAYFEPQFSARSHGFRPGRGCHTALKGIHRSWNGTTWFIEGDISQYFDKLDHQVLVGILAEQIHDGRFLRLIADLLKAGYLEDWTFNTTLSGTPQGGVVSPILANIYLDRFDKWVETTLLSTYNRKAKRDDNQAYHRLLSLAYLRDKKGLYQEAAALRKQAKQLPIGDLTDPEYRKLRYLRYADDFLLGFTGPRDEAERIKQHLRDFLSATLKLELSEEKTLITHARTEAARFLGYEISTLQDDTARTSTGRRRINGVIGLKVPLDVVKERCRRYMKHGKPVHRPEILYDSVFSTVQRYQVEYRGIVEYYRLAYNLHRFNELKWVMEQSLTKTLAAKLKISVAKVYDHFGTTLQTPDGPYKGLQVIIERTDRKPLVATWGGINLRRNLTVVLNDQPARIWNNRTDLEQRLLANTCELCGSQENVQVHHIRAMKDLRKRDRTEKPAWVTAMAARHRKTLVVCLQCHTDIQYGHPRHNTKTG